MNRSTARLAQVADVFSRLFRPTRLSVLSLILLLISGFIVSQIRRPVASSVFASAGATSVQTLATMSDTVTVHAAGRGKPYINFSDGHDVLTGYGSASTASAALQSPASPLAMASADFDEDGVPDLVSGYSVGGAGMLILHRGNVDSVYPNAPEAQQRRATGVFTDAPFLSPARVFDLPVAADFVGAGDFDADGHWDVVIANRGDNALHFLAGDGEGNFSGAQRIELPGRVTAMATGEVNRADGLIDVVVGVATSSGPRALVFESPEGALRGKAESFDLPDEATAIAIGNLDAEYTMDIAIAAGRELMVINGRDRKLSLDENQQATVPKPRMSRRAFSFGLKSVAIGDFKGDHNLGLAVLTDEGSVHLLSAVSAKAKKKGIKKWKDEAWASGSWAQATQIVRSRVSSVPSDDLVIVDGPGHKLHIVAKAAPSQQQQANTLQSVSFDVEDEPMAVMPMRLNPDALSDLVVLRKGQVGPTAMTSQPAMFFQVFINADDGFGSLRDAITQANANAGLDTIVFVIGSGPQTITPTSPLPTITDAVTIDGTTQPGFAGSPIIELNGSNAGSTGDGLSISSGNSTVRGMVINRFQGDSFASGRGIVLATNGNNLIEGNFIGTNVSGNAALANFGSGVNILSGASSDVVGGTTSATRNIISGNGFDGVTIGITGDGGGTTGNQIQGNFIGTDSSGTASIGNDNQGVQIVDAPSNTVGGTVVGARNIISGGATTGVVIGGNAGPGNQVQGNFIGTDVTGTQPLGQTFGGGVDLVGPNNIVGGTSPGAGNVISANGGTGGVTLVSIPGSAATGNLVQGNLIGTDVTGTIDLGNSFGLFIQNASGNVIGGTTAGARNNISGNNNQGVLLTASGTTGNQVQGNFIGTDVTGTLDLGNSQQGVLISSGASNNTIGGTAAGARNIISGNAQSGVQIQNTGSQNQVIGNFIGTDVSGTVDLGNFGDGVNINISSNNVVGGITPGAGNVISGNKVNGVRILANGNQVQGNFIGTDVTGSASIGNTDSGVRVFGSNNRIGGARNIIANNGSAGVFVGLGLNNVFGVGNEFLSNSMFSNGGLAIDLGGDGVTPNDSDDKDPGPNNFQNFPVLTAAFPSGTRLNIQGTLNSTANTTFTVQFFANSNCDPSGFGEGEALIGSTQVTTDASSNASFTFFAAGAQPGQSITATATDPAGNTSEFSNCIAIGTGALNLALTKSVSPTAVRPGNNVTYTITVTNNGPAIANNVVVTDNLPAQVTFVSCSSTVGSCGGSGNSRSLTVPLLALNGTATLTLVATVSPSAANGTVINNTATVTGSLAGGGSATATASAAVTVSTQAPAINCPPNVLAAAAQGQTSAVVNYPPPTVAGNPANVIVTCTPPSGSTFPIGTTTVNCKATDAATNTSSCSFSVTVNQGNPSVDKTTVDFGSPIAVPNQNPPADTFTITNASDASVDLTLTSIRRTGSDVGGRITNPDDSGFFTVFAINPGGVDVQLNPGSTIPIPAGQRNFRVTFNPSIPAVASGTSNLSASQVLPDVITSSLNFNSSGGSLTVNMTGRVATGLLLIDPANPTRSPVVTFTKSGNQFNLTYSVFDSNLNVTRASHQFLDSGGQPSGQPIEVSLTQALQAINLVKGQSFTVDQPFTGASSHPEIAGVRVTVFDGETSVSATATLGSSAASNAPADDSQQRMTVVLPRLRIRRLAP